MPSNSQFRLGSNGPFAPKPAAAAPQSSLAAPPQPRKLRAYSPCIHQLNANAAALEVQNQEKANAIQENRISVLEEDKKSLQEYVQKLNQNVQDLLKALEEKDAQIDKLQVQVTSAVEGQKDAWAAVSTLSKLMLRHIF